MKNVFRILVVILSIFLTNSCKKDKPTPPIMTTTAVTEISYTTATSGGNITNEGGAPILSRGICWNTSVDPTITNSKTTEIGASGEFTSTITPLTPNTLYYVRAYATNSAGTGYGNQVTFTTSQTATATLTTAEITSITQTSAVSGGNITADNGGSVTSRGVCWCTSQTPTLADSKSEDGTGTGIFTSSIDGLTQGTTYYIRAYATNSVGTSYGAQVSFNTSSESRIQDIIGYAQKGPFINGSSITVYDLQSDLSPTGKSFNSQITDNKGTFQLSNISLSSNYVKIRTDGFYYNEISGQQSASQITLYALSDITGKSNINVNIVTNLEKSRVEYLMKNGNSFAASKTQTQKEILAIFNIEKSDIKTSENLNISESGDDNGILLAISSILQGYRSESEMAELLSNISNDIKEDGILNSDALGSALINHAIILDTTSIKNNLAKRYSDIGATVAIPDFGKYIANFITKTEYVVTQSPVSYPETGINGDNILSLSKTTYNGGLDITHSLSLAAQLAKGTALKIKITSLTTIITEDDTSSTEYRPVWGSGYGTSINWSISLFDNTNFTQTFTAIESGKSCDLRMYFEKGSFLIEYFEMNSTVPTRTKTIICN